MSTNLERITAHNNKLAQLKEVAAELPEAGSGGGSFETCTVTFIARSAIERFAVTTVVDGIISCEYYEAFSEGSMGISKITIENVLCGSMIYLYEFVTAASISVSGGMTFLL